MTERLEPGVFLERRSYRRRRLLDGLRLLPFIGAWLFILPVFWRQAGEEEARMTSDALLFVFGAWLVLTILCALLLWAYNRSGAEGTESG
ncbi:hypothetical protein E4Z66_00425 [Aliishimia ponticola]|uniref:Uncharacterized protein n=1 Tax=Aliishimia ponticola TaxID=2499833 RepID=A0A4S4NEZ7_9RHOB|nr:hypothetical protein [Aliishimia ponticola]THH38079.1 hypothetical protein E4Z66_00425 [Aliishimia ponticola]